jgi:hypothetical protein
MRLRARFSRWVLVCLALVCLVRPMAAAAQGVTTGSIAGVVTDQQKRPVAGASVVAIHEPSGTVYETTTRADGGFSIPGMRLGGPYTVMVNHAGQGTAFSPLTKRDILVNLGVSTDMPLTVTPVAVTETVTVTAEADPVFSLSRTGASTSVSRLEIATLPTVTGRIQDITRLTPQANGMSFGQDNRLNNITVDGSFFNNAFGLGDGQPGGRTSVAPISLESLEQIQVNIAPFDVRQGNFIGANVNSVTRSGTNQIVGSFYTRYRNQSYAGTEAKGQTFNPGQFKTKMTGEWLGGPIVKNKLFYFVNFENESDVRPLNTFRANRGGETVGGNITRVLASDLDQVSALLNNQFGYVTGPYEGAQDETPQKRFLLRTDYNLGKANKISFRYSQLNSSSDSNLSSSSSAGFGRNTFTTNHLNFAASNYEQLENIKSGVGELNSVIGNTMANTLIVGYTSNNENRGDIGKLFPFVDIRDGSGVAYMSFGSEPFTPQNQLTYNTFQLKDDFTKFGTKHTWTFGGTMQKYKSNNVFNSLSQSAYVYRTLQDFYTDMTHLAANPNRTTTPVTYERFQVRYINIPGITQPFQPLEVTYAGGYAQDEWRARPNLTIQAGIRADVSTFGATGYENPTANALSFRNRAGQSVQYKTQQLPETKILWAPRLGFNWDVRNDKTLQIRGGTGVFSGPPLYVWISNQIGQNGVITGLVDETAAASVRNRPFTSDVDRYKPTNVTGASAASYELNVTDPDFKFPQLWRSNIAVDRKMPWGITGTSEFIYNKEMNGILYINANLPAAQTAFTGVDPRPRWTANRINSTAGNVVTANYVMTNQSEGKSWSVAFSASKPLYKGLSLRTAYSYGETRNMGDPGSTAATNWSGTAHSGDPNNPGVGYAVFNGGSAGHRAYIQATYTNQWFKFGATTVSAFWNTNTFSNTSYVFAGDMNGDGASANDLIYIPRDTGEMNFVQFTCPATTCGTAKTFTAAEQATAFEAYIQQDPYLSKHRGEYAKRGAVFVPRVTRLDVSVIQQVFGMAGGARHSGEFRVDFLNFGNLMNSNWGVSQRVVQNQILTNAAADTQGRASYRLAVVNQQLLAPKTFQTNAALQDVWTAMLSFRYRFN